MQYKTRSYKKITGKDFQRLAHIALTDLEDLFNKRPELSKLYRNRRFLITLCQGAALHYIDGKTGIKDFDVWSFFQAHTQQPFPYRRRGKRDYGDPKFGKTRGCSSYAGRRVDLIGRSINRKRGEDPVLAVRRYLRESRNRSPKFLSEKAVVVIDPPELCGQVIWPE